MACAAAGAARARQAATRGGSAPAASTSRRCLPARRPAARRGGARCSAAEQAALQAHEALPALAAASAAALAASVGGFAWERDNCEPPPEAAPQGAATRPEAGRAFTLGLVPIFLATPFFARATYRSEAVPGRLWSFEQKQGIGLGLNTSLNVRMTVGRLASGNLFVYGPVAPTGECRALIEELLAQREGSKVELIVLGTSLLEHKQFLAPFARAYPAARVLVSPGQWSWPLNLPLRLLGVARAEEVRDGDASQLPAELQSRTLDLPPVGLLPWIRFTEVALYHAPTRSLMVTDAAMRLPDAPPPTVSERDLLEWADDRNTAISGLRLLRLFGVEEAARRYGLKRAGEREPAAARALGWRRMALTALFFGQRDVLRPEATWAELTARPLLVPPVVGVLVYGDVAAEKGVLTDTVAQWSAEVAKWPFRRVLPAHFAIADAGPREWSAAFAQWQRKSSSTVASAARDGVAASPLQRLAGAIQAALPASSPLGRVSDRQAGRKGTKEYYPAQDVQCLKDVRGALISLGIVFTEATRPERPLPRK